MKFASRIKPSVPQVEPGTYLATCVQIVDLGEQECTFKGKTKYNNQVLFSFELAGETVEIDGEEKPRWLSRSFTVSSSDKSNLRKFLTAWRGTAFTSAEEMEQMDIGKAFLGRTGMIQVVASETGYSNIDGIMRIPKGMKAPTTDTELIIFDQDAWDEETFGKLSEYIQEKIKNSTQYKSWHAPTDVVDIPDEEDKPEADVPDAVPAVPKKNAKKPLTVPADDDEEDVIPF